MFCVSKDSEGLKDGPEVKRLLWWLLVATQPEYTGPTFAFF